MNDQKILELFNYKYSQVSSKIGANIVEANPKLKENIASLTKENIKELVDKKDTERLEEFEKMLDSFISGEDYVEPKYEIEDLRKMFNFTDEELLAIWQ